MLPTLSPTAPVILTPTGDPTPVEKAVVDGIAADFGPEMFLYTVFYRPDGSCRIWYAWTAGGHQLGDRIDRTALAAGLDCADNFYIARRHLTEHQRGRVRVEAHPLRLIMADVQSGVRASEPERDKVRRLIGIAPRTPASRSSLTGPCPAGWVLDRPCSTERPRSSAPKGLSRRNR
ncbi:MULTISPECIES: hypothetical protein [Streptomyces]|uniref:hypothetical protein n=1 Tax=Streptomyces TaxID=1883 RepID=UPI00025CE366|nr:MULTISPECIES: hypothetical protein [Streptomyces]EIF90703.1 hypothetical protein [Streptomyces tsukubensis NRRL18488]